MLDFRAVRNASGQVIAAISISGPDGRMGSNPGRRYAPLVYGCRQVFDRRLD